MNCAKSRNNIQTKCQSIEPNLKSVDIYMSAAVQQLKWSYRSSDYYTGESASVTQLQQSTELQWQLTKATVQTSIYNASENSSEATWKCNLGLHIKLQMVKLQHEALQFK